MRLELETTQMTLNEFVDFVLACNESVELTRDGKVILVATKAAKMAHRPNTARKKKKR